MSIRLEEINESNCEECVKLRVGSGQEVYMSPNGAAIAHWKFHPDWKPLGIYEDDKMIGFTMYEADNAKNAINIISFMVDERYQGRGYGKAAMEKLISFIRKYNNRSQILAGIHPRDDEAQRLYKQFGFRQKDVDVHDEDKIFYALEIS